MCGIAGFVMNEPIADYQRVIEAMTSVLAHRGPDGHGYWTDKSMRVHFGHRRLSILDLSESGKQPMVSSSRRYAVTFNGEIYNFKSLRTELSALGHQFKGGSDTEVMLAAVEHWGLNVAVQRFVGMFAFALWDDVEKSLCLVRDRIGKKPLYYCSANGAVAFASELKSLKKFPGFDSAIDRGSVALYLRHNYIPAPRSIYTAARKVEAGSFLKFVFDGESSNNIEEVRYWDLREVAAKSIITHQGMLRQTAADEFETLLEDAVALRMIADVPLGAFLSGGVDSSLVVALMAKQSSLPVKTFTIGFDEAGFDEAIYAKQISRHLGTDHTELYIAPEQARAVIPKLAQVYDEPFSDSSQIPTYLISQLARTGVTVALSGDGGDELACGYNRYIWMKELLTWMRFFPLPLRRAVAALVRNGGASALEVLVRVLKPGMPNPRERVLKAAHALSSANPRDVYRYFISHWSNPEEVVRGAPMGLPDLAEPVSRGPVGEVIESLMIVDTLTYLPDDILVKVDRASMAHSLEVRAPLLDHRLFEFSRGLPLDYHLKGSRGKQILRGILRKHVPDDLIERPKMGFGVPLATWLRGPLREWAEDLLSPARMDREGILSTKLVRDKWRAFVACSNDSHYLIWDVLMFQSWLDAERA